MLPIIQKFWKFLFNNKNKNVGNLIKKKILKF